MGRASLRHAQLAVLAVGHSDVSSVARCFWRMNQKLRVGVLTSSTHLYAWQCALLQRIQNSTHAEIALLVLGDGPPRTDDLEPRAQRRTWLQDIAARIIERVYLRLERGILCEHDAF